MWRGKIWHQNENEVLARAWKAASEDHIAGTDQTAKCLMHSVRQRLFEKGPDTSEVLEGMHGFRSSMIIKKHFSGLSEDVQNCFLSVAKVRASNPTGVGDEGIISMEVETHLGFTTNMKFVYQNFDKNSWLY